MKLTPKNKDTMYTQGPPNPRIIACRSASGVSTLAKLGCYYNPHVLQIFISAVRKPSGTLRLLVYLRRINLLIRQEYDNLTFPVATLADVNARLAGKSFREVRM